MILTLYDTFKHWSDGGSVYIISDTHFADPDCRHMDPNWISPEEQVKILNKCVHKKDTLILLGDVGDIEYVKQLNSYKVLVMGNHDESITKFKGIFNEIFKGPVFISEKILLSHEPIQGLNFCLNIHGHEHNQKQESDVFHLNVAANICGYEPVCLTDIIKQGRLSKIKSIHRETIDKATKRKVTCN